MQAVETRITQKIINTEMGIQGPWHRRTLSSGRDGREPQLAPWRQRTTAERQKPAIHKPILHDPQTKAKTKDRSTRGITC